MTLSGCGADAANHHAQWAALVAPLGTDPSVLERAFFDQSVLWGDGGGAPLVFCRVEAKRENDEALEVLIFASGALESLKKRGESKPSFKQSVRIVFAESGTWQGAPHGAGDVVTGGLTVKWTTDGSVTVDVGGGTPLRLLPSLRSYIRMGRPGTCCSSYFNC